MRNCLLFIVLLVSTVSAAQITVPEGEVYGGYQYMRLDAGAVQDAVNLFALQQEIAPLNFGRHQNLNGWSFGVQENLNSWFGVVVDVGGAYLTKKTVLAQSPGLSEVLRTRLRNYTFMGGPQFTLRHSSTFQPFVRALVGGAFSRNSLNILLNNVPQSSEVKVEDEGFAFGGGAGTDINFSRMLGLRVAVDYIGTKLFDDTQNNIRGTASLVFRWGSK